MFELMGVNNVSASSIYKVAHTTRGSWHASYEVVVSHSYEVVVSHSQIKSVKKVKYRAILGHLTHEYVSRPNKRTVILHLTRKTGGSLTHVGLKTHLSKGKLTTTVI